MFFYGFAFTVALLYCGIDSFANKAESASVKKFQIENGAKEKLAKINGIFFIITAMIYPLYYLLGKVGVLGFSSLFSENLWLICAVILLFTQLCVQKIYVKSKKIK